MDIKKVSPWPPEMRTQTQKKMWETISRPYVICSALVYSQDVANQITIQVPHFNQKEAHI